MARVIDFIDGVTSETPPTIGNIVASALVQYADDTAYEANEQGAPTTGNIYYNTTDNVIRYYNGADWISLVDETTTQTIISKNIDADNNTITNLENDNIKAGAAIDAAKLANGEVSNTEFQYLDGVTNPIQTQLDAKLDDYGAGTDNALLKSNAAGDGVERSGVIVDDSDNVTIPGDLTVNGTTTTINSENLDVEDQNITVNKNGNDASSEGAGLTVERTGTDGSLIYEDALVSKFKAGPLGSEVELANVSGQQTLTNKDIDGGIASNTRRLTLPQDTKANLLLLTRKEGTLLYANDEDLVYYDDGINLIPVGSGAGGSGTGGINYVKNPNAEINANDVNTYNDGAVDEPVDGDGGTALSIAYDRTTDSTEILIGQGSHRINKSAANAQGEGVHFNLDPIDPTYKNERLQISFRYKHPAPLSNNYVSGDLAVFIYAVDGTPQLLGRIENDDNGDILRHEGEGSTFIGWFNATDSLNYRLLIHQTSTAATTARTIIDNVTLGPVGFVPVTVQRDEFIDLTGSGDFTGGSIRISKVGSVVTISEVIAITFSSNSSPESAASMLPSWAIPDEQKWNTTINSISGSYIASSIVTTDGKYILQFTDHNGDADSRTTSAGLSSITYSVLESTNVVSNTQLTQKTAIAKATVSTSQTIPSGVITKCDLDVLEIQEGSGLIVDLTNNDIIIKQPGFFLITGQCGTINNVAGGQTFIEIYKNDTTRIGSSNVSAGELNDDPVASTAVIEELSVDETVQLRVFQDSGSNSTPFDGKISVMYIPDFTSYGVINPSLLLNKVVRQTAYAQTSGGANVWVLPDSSFSLDVDPGTYELALIGESISETTGAWTGSIRAALSTSLTPGSGLLTGETPIIDIQNSLLSRGNGNVTFEPITITSPQTIYVHLIARNSLGTPTFTSNGFGYTGSAATPLRLTLKRLR